MPRGSACLRRVSDAVNTRSWKASSTTLPAVRRLDAAVGGAAVPSSIQSTTCRSSITCCLRRSSIIKEAATHSMQRPISPIQTPTSDSVNFSCSPSLHLRLLLWVGLQTNINSQSWLNDPPVNMGYQVWGTVSIGDTCPTFLREKQTYLLPLTFHMPLHRRASQFLSAFVNPPLMSL